MSLPAKTNAVGYYQGDVVVPNDYKIHNGYEGTTQEYHYPYLSRSFESWKPAPHTVPISYDLGIPWRAPTSWTRSILNYHYIPSEKTWTTIDHGGTVYTHTQRGVVLNFPLHHLQEKWGHMVGGIMDTDQHRQAKAECMNKLNEGKVHLGQFLAESKKSAELILDTGENLLQALLAVKRGQFSRVPKNLGTQIDRWGNAWLVWQYGWKPLAADIHGLWETFKENLPRPHILRAERTVVTPHNYEFWRNGNKVTVQLTHRDKCKVWAKLKSEFLADAQKLDVVNPLSLTWELIPYSFVVDWFAPMGSYLSALNAHAGLDFVGGFVSQTREGSYTVSETDVGTAIKEFFLFEREALSTWPSLGVYAVENPFKITRAVSTMALLNQLWRRSR